MTRRDRLLAIYRGEVPDRPAVRLWGAAPDQDLLHPAFEPVRDAAAGKTDLVLGSGSPIDLRWGAQPPPIHTETRETGDPDWIDHVKTIETPAGTLRSVWRESTSKNPGRTIEYLLKEPEDLEKLLSVDYVPHPFDPQPFRESEEKVGDRGITVFGLPHAMYGLEDAVGSENFAIWSRTHRQMLLEVMREYGRRILQHVERAVSAGIRGVFGYVGPELCIPPLMGVADFEEFVTPIDAPIIDAIHEGGSHAWVHCHGRMGPVLERFSDMGVDVLNPLEPPPMGDITLGEAFDRLDGRMGIEGNIETHDIMRMEPENFRHLVAETVEIGRGERFIICPSSGYMENPQPTDRQIRNLLTFVNYGVECAEG